MYKIKIYSTKGGSSLSLYRTNFKDSDFSHKLRKKQSELWAMERLVSFGFHCFCVSTKEIEDIFWTVMSQGEVFVIKYYL